MRRIIYALPVILLLLGGSPLSSQQFYKFSARSATYTELKNPSVIIGDSSQIVNAFSGYGVKGPFVIEAFGQKLDFNADPAPVVFAGGFLGVDITAKQRFYVFDVFTSQFAWRDSSTSVSVQLVGDPGEGILKVQWKNMALAGNPAGDFVNMQLWLNEKDNSFEVHVGPNHVTASAGYFGNNGPAIGAFVSTYDLIDCDAGVHLTGDPAKPGLNLAPLSYYPMGGTPPNGTVYRFDYIPSSSSSVDAISDKVGGVSFLPNPSRDRSLIELPEALEGTNPTLVMHDVLGREVLRIDNVAGGDYIETGALSAGVYYVTLSRGGRTYNGGRLVVAR